MSFRTFLLATLAPLAALAPVAHAADGYPLANFALTVNASQDGDFFGEILRNPGRLGRWLQNEGGVAFAVEKDGKRHTFSGFAEKQIKREFPFVTGNYAKSPAIASRIETLAFCPLRINNTGTSARPVLMLEINITAPADKGEVFDIVVTPKGRVGQGEKIVWENFTSTLSGPDMKSKLVLAGIVGTRVKQTEGPGDTASAKDKKIQQAAHVSIMTDITTQFWKQGQNGEYRITLTLKAGERKHGRFAITFYDSQWLIHNGVSGSENDNPKNEKTLRPLDAITLDTFEHWQGLKDSTQKFSAALPATGDAALDRCLRWYVIPALSLTKCTAKGEIVTMGYRELNQRDSFWTSWLHLVLFKDAERKMLDETVAHQRADGKIPTTILPLIERNDDLDINAFFILRAARYYAYWGDKDALRRDWPALVKAQNWLISRDSDGIGLPAQVSLWGDWKDVRGVAGRKYSPFSGLVYLAALKKMTSLARVVNDTDAVVKYNIAYAKGFERINRPVTDGGLWNGDYYCQINKDGTVNDHLLQDQTLGILYGVVPRDRAEKIIAALNARSLTPYGIAETTPYYPASFGYAPATYHNGAVWPWLSFMDCWARVKLGRKAEAIDLVKRVAKADLEDSGDWSPNEHINSKTGQNLGFHIQGWNAGIFGLVYFGILEKEPAKEIP
jgi:uncharacterized protein (DUF608 family)